jgi:hypothetical protein
MPFVSLIIFRRVELALIIDTLVLLVCFPKKILWIIKRNSSRTKYSNNKKIMIEIDMYIIFLTKSNCMSEKKVAAIKIKEIKVMSKTLSHNKMLKDLKYDPKNFLKAITL